MTVKQNRYAPWILFEAGALSKAMDSARVCPLLIDLKSNEVPAPLGKLQMVPLDKTGIFDLLKMINQPAATDPLPPETLEHNFNQWWWPDFKCEIDSIISAIKPVPEEEPISYDKRIIIALTPEQAAEVREKGVIPDNASIVGRYNALSIFGYNEAKREVTWGNLADKLNTRSATYPWPEGAIRWGEALGRMVGRALQDELHPEDAEALPLYFDYREKTNTGICYRPSLSRKVQEDGMIKFDIVFVQLPPELFGYPGDALGSLCHYLTFCRMVRWTLESDRFK